MILVIISWLLRSAGGERWPFDTTGPFDCWIYWAPPFHAGEVWRYLPIIYTLGSGLSEVVNATVAYADERLAGNQYLFKEARRADEMELEVRAARAAGKRAIVVVLGFWNARNESRIASLDAHVVLYQSEALNRKGSRILTPKRVDYFVAEWSVREVWDYSPSNVAYARRVWPSSVSVRLVHPGYVPEYDLGVNLDSPAVSTRVGFVGNRNPTNAARDMAASRAFWETGEEHRRVGDWIQMRTFLQSHPIQLVHHRASNEDGPFESFRGAVLFANKACVISETSHPADLRYWQPLVFAFVSSNRTFRTIFRTTPAPALTAASKLDAVAARLATNATLLRDCRIATYDIFRRQFAAPRILYAANIHNIFHKETTLGFAYLPDGL